MLITIKHKWIIFLIPLAFVFHNIEEYLNLNDIDFNFIFSTIGLTFPTEIVLKTYGVALIIATVLPFAVAYFFVKRPSKKTNLIYSILVAGTLINSLQHILSYASGVMVKYGFYTALFINLPLSIYVLYFLSNKNQIFKSIMKPTIWAIVLYVPVIMAMLMLSYGIISAINLFTQ